MIWRASILAFAVLCGFTGAQVPEFSQQYVQRLGGAVDALAQVVSDFDASASASGLSRQEALEQMQGTDFLDRRRRDMARTFLRFERLSAQLEALQTAPALQRAASIARAPDGEVARATFAVFQPGLPLSKDGLLFGLSGALAGLGVAGLMGRLFRRGRATA